MNDANGATAQRIDAGAIKDGTRIEAVVLSSGNGHSARILSYGATLQALYAPDRAGRPGDIVLGHDTVAEYEAKQNYFGATVGRYANRILRGRFSLDGVTYQLPHNDGVNSLHGGGAGFDRAVWTIGTVTSGPEASVVLSHVSPDGAAGYPGEVSATVTYSLNEAGELTIAFAASTTKPTILNMTNHAIYNLAGECAPQGAMGQRLTILASRYTPVDETLIPTGELRPVKGTAFDFTTPQTLAARLREGRDPQIAIGRGYDHNWVLDKGQTSEPQLAAHLEDSTSGRTLDLLTTEPGLQVYTGNFLDGTVVGKRGCVYRMGDGVALESQKFPDAPNQPGFGSARIDPGKPYRHIIVLRMKVLR